MRKLKFPTSITAGLAVVLIVLWGGPALALPAISNVYPNGTNMFQPSTTLTFNASSGSGVTNIVVDLTATNLYTGSLILSHLTSASGLTITSVTNVSAPLATNTLYGATIKVYDASGSVTNSVKFDTINPVYTWEAEDFDYTNGLYFDTGVNRYANLAGVEGVDYHNGNPANGNAAYRPKGLETENPNSGDSPLRLQYIGTTNFDYNVGWTSGGDWGNYTRHYPAGTYTLFVRTAGGGSPQTESGDISILSGTATSTNVAPFKYGVKGTGWGNYDFMPVTDAGGNLVQITFPSDGSACTLRETQVNASDNINFFMLMPVPVIVPSTVTITNVTPDGSVQFQPSNSLSFTVSSPVAINLGSVQVQLSVTSLFGSNSASVLTIGSGLSYTGNATNITVTTTALTSNMIYSVLILANDANGIPGSYGVGFDTISPSYTFEAEDFNYGGGLYIDNPPPDAYKGAAHDGIADIDYHKPSNNLGAYGRAGLNCENANDKRRAAYNIGGGVYTNDYDVGNTSGGDWGDYTRTFPAGSYNIFVRVARGNGGTVTDAGKISIVTSNPTLTGQTIQDLGKHNTPSTGGWQSYVWMPVLNTAGYPARFVATGSPMTLRYTFDGAGDNLGFVMLLPAVGGNTPPFASSFTPDGAQMFQPSNTLTFVVNSSVGISQANVHLNLNGVNVSNLTFSGSSTLWTVSYPIQTNKFYTAVVTLTDTAGTTSSTNVFTTYDSSSYQWEAEDYDYSNGLTAGLYFDNPQVGSYAGLAGKSGVDLLEADPNGPSRGNSYRPAGFANFPDTAANDQARTQFTTAGKTDYSIGSFGPASWANYTRHYPAGTYNVVGRFAEGAAPTVAMLSQLTSGYGTTLQTSNFLGTFNIPLGGWSSWEWVQLVDNSGNPVKVTLDGTLQTLQLEGSPVGSQPEANVNFFMLVATTPSPKLTATVSGGSIHISFLTQTGYSYQLLYKNNLTDATWTPVGSAIPGDGTVHSPTDTTATGKRFYQVQIQ